MNLLSINRTTIGKVRKYATTVDFGTLFTEQMSDLYLLCFLLTGNQVKAEQCFVSGFEDSIKANPVFKHWARSWARRMIIQNAIRIIAPRPDQVREIAPVFHLEFNTKTLPVLDKDSFVASVLELANFERFVFVMSVLERSSDQDCSVLLGCTRQEIVDARTQALQRIASNTAEPRTDSVAA